MSSSMHGDSYIFSNAINLCLTWAVLRFSNLLLLSLILDIQSITAWASAKVKKYDNASTGVGYPLDQLHFLYTLSLTHSPWFAC